MGQYETHVFVCTSGDDCPKGGDVEVRSFSATSQ
jgi:hypothetical protein